MRMPPVLARLIVAGLVLVAVGPGTAATAAVASSAVVPTSYTATDLAAFGDGAYSRATGINAGGKVVGEADNGANNPSVAYLWDGTMHDLQAGDYSLARGINATGKVVGQAYLDAWDPDGWGRAFLYDGSLHNLGTLGGKYSYANAINDGGIVVGASEVVPDSYEDHSFLYDPAASPPMRDLGTLGGDFSEATAINNAGLVVGSSSLTAGDRRAFLYDPGTTPSMREIAPIGGASTTVANGINDSGQVAGYQIVQTGPDPRNATPQAFIYQNGTLTLLDPLPGFSGSMAYGMNNLGQVVGQCVGGGQNGHAVLWNNDANHTPIDLNDLVDPTVRGAGWLMQQAKAINDDGKIAVDGENENPDNWLVHAFLLTPVFPPADTTAPTTTASRSPAPNGSGWNRTDIAVTLTATDNAGGSGVSKTEYRIGTGAWATYSAPFSITTEGQTTVGFRSADNAGNTEADRSITVKIDRTAPTTTASAAGYTFGDWTSSDVTVTLSAADSSGGSGIARIEHLLDDATTWTTYSAPLKVTTEGEHTLKFRATDNAGNTEPEKSVAIKIKRTASELAVSFDPARRDLIVTGPSGPISPSSVKATTPAGATSPAIELRTYQQGSALTLVIKVARTDRSMSASITSLQANGREGTLPTNDFKYSWSVARNGSLDQLNQQIVLGSGVQGQALSATFTARLDRTVLQARNVPNVERSSIRPGLIILKMNVKDAALSLGL